MSFGVKVKFPDASKFGSGDQQLVNRLVNHVCISNFDVCTSNIKFIRCLLYQRIYRLKFIHDLDTKIF